MAQYDSSFSLDAPHFEELPNILGPVHQTIFPPMLGCDDQCIIKYPPLLYIGTYKDNTVAVWSTHNYSLLSATTLDHSVHEAKWDPFVAYEFASVGTNIKFWLVEEDGGGKTCELKVCLWMYVCVLYLGSTCSYSRTCLTSLLMSCSTSCNMCMACLYTMYMHVIIWYPCLSSILYVQFTMIMNSCICIIVFVGP